MTAVNPARPPKDILEPAELEKIRTLQITKEVFLLGGFSPDDKSILVVAGTSEDLGQALWLNLETGQFDPIDSKLLELFPRGEIAWSSEQNALYLSKNTNGDPVLVTLQRETEEATMIEIAKGKDYQWHMS